MKLCSPEVPANPIGGSGRPSCLLDAVAVAVVWQWLLAETVGDELN
jgi:hypothetical protein